MTAVALWRRMTTEPARPARVRDSRYAPWLVVGTVCVGAFMGQLDASIVTLALPTLQHEFHASLGQVEWVALSYLIVLVGSVTVVGRVADMAGRKLLYTYGFGVFTLGAALCGLAPSLPFLDGARVLQAVGAAMLQANSVALIANALPRDKLGRGIGIQGAAQAVGLALGPAVGGLLIGVGGWRLIFFLNVPAGLLGLALGWFLLPRTRELAPSRRFDWLGAALLMPAASALLAALSFGPERGWASPLIVGLFSGAAAAGLAFVVRERVASSPMVQLDLFRKVPFSAGISSGLLSYLVTFGVLFAVPFSLQARHTPTNLAGLELTVLPAALAVVAPVAGRVADRVGARPVTVTGMLVTAAGLVALGLGHGTLVQLLPELVVIGAGLGAFTPANNAAIMGSAPRAQSGVAGGILNMTRGLGTSLGVAVTGVVFVLAPAGQGGLLAAGLVLAVVSCGAAGLSLLRERPAEAEGGQARPA
ncbi:MAG TPA: MFS transporter [Candidatus Binatia bacterium]|nr:MFS transporter [Candidatus Binatia bacterium]